MSEANSNNESIRFTDYDVIGFDMDLTLARYKLVPFFNLTYGCLRKYLVEKKNYDASIFHGLLEDKDLVYSGLIAHCEKGNILKLASDGSIIRATHGTKLMSEEEVVAAYGEKKKFPHFEDFINGVKCLDGKWRFCDNFFNISGIVIYGQIIDHFEMQESKSESLNYLQMFCDICEAFEDMYTATQFEKGRGVFFPSIKTSPRTYLDACSEQVTAWLRSLRQDGRKLFLLTTSFPDYAELVMTSVFGKDWRKLFDICLYNARKPKFFTEAKPFYKVSGGMALEEVNRLEAGKEYSQGNHQDFSVFLRTLTGKNDPKVLYMGDNLFADAWPCTSKAGWDAVLILEEMDAEGYAVSDGTVAGHDDEMEDPAVAPAKRKRRYEHSSLVTEEEIELMVSKFWGSVFIDHGSLSGDSKEAVGEDLRTMNTCYGNLISQYSTICVPSIEYLAGVAVNHEFKTFSKEPGNARGFHPGRPRSILPS